MTYKVNNLNNLNKCRVICKSCYIIIDCSYSNEQSIKIFKDIIKLLNNRTLTINDFKKNDQCGGVVKYYCYEDKKKSFKENLPLITKHLKRMYELGIITYTEYSNVDYI